MTLYIPSNIKVTSNDNGKTTLLFEGLDKIGENYNSDVAMYIGPIMALRLLRELQKAVDPDTGV